MSRYPDHNDARACRWSWAGDGRARLEAAHRPLANPSTSWCDPHSNGAATHLAYQTGSTRPFETRPPGSIDRSPCGTGTSAKMACLYTEGKLKEGQIWRQESIVGSVFEGTVAIVNDEIRPSIKGSAFITVEADLILDQRDPFCMGIRR